MLSKEFNIKSLCEYMNISRSGYYKWLKNKDKLNRYEINRLEIEKLVKDIHKKKPSYGYRRINRIILRTTGWIISDNLVHKVCKCLKIKSQAKHYKYKKSGEESIKLTAAKYCLKIKLFQKNKTIDFEVKKWQKQQKMSCR